MSITLGELDREALQTYAQVKAAENWSKVYQENPDTHKKIIRAGVRLETKLRKYFRDMSEDAHQFINWVEYSKQVTAAVKVDVLINDRAFGSWNETFIRVVFEDIALSTAIGAQAGESLYKMPLGLTSTSKIIQDVARTQIAELVGKKIDKSGNMIDNPSARYRVTDKIRGDVASSIRSSIDMGETQAQAVERLSKTIRDPKRAEIIAQTESVNAYQRGEFVFANESGAVGKVWEDNDAIDECADHAALGPVPIDFDYGGVQVPPAHPRCRCGERYIYKQEWDKLNV